MRIVLDTNIVLSSISRHSPYRLILDSFETKVFELAVSNEILFEYEEKIEHFFSSETASLFIGALYLKSNVYKSDIFYRWNLITADADDNKFVDCAIASNADFIVTNDKDFRILKSIDFPVIKVISIDEFIELLRYQ